MKPKKTYEILAEASKLCNDPEKSGEFTKFLWKQWKEVPTKKNKR